MVLETIIGRALPPGAIALSKDEALDYQQKFIHSWPVEKDVFFLKYGKYITATTTIVSSVTVLKFFKEYFKIGVSPVLYASYVTCGAVPTAFSYIITDAFITNNVLLMKKECPVCDELKFGLSQLYSSVIYPAIFGCFSFGSYAERMGTYYFPDVKTEPKEFWRETFRILKKSSKVLQLVTLGQLAWILFLPYMQNKQLLNVVAKAKGEVADEDLTEFHELEK